MLGVFLDRDTMHPDDLDFGRLEATLPRWRFYDNSDAADVSSRIAAATVVVANKVQLDADALVTPNLKLVCVTATGVNNIDLAAAQKQGIAVCNVRGYATAAVSQHVFSLILALSTRLFDYHSAVRQGSWQRSQLFCLLDYPIRELAGKVLGVVGYGTLGQAVANLARAFGMTVLVAQRSASPPQEGRIALAELLPRVDVLTLHCPLTPDTHGLIGARELALMKSDAILVNTARGGIVDEAALARALKCSALAGAGIDVLSTEPPAAGNPLLDTDVPNLIVTPHVAWASREARQRSIDETAKNIVAFLAGNVRNVL